LGRLDGCGGEGPSTCINRHGDAESAVYLELVGADDHVAFLVVVVHRSDGANPEGAAIEAGVLLDHVLDHFDGVQPRLVGGVVMFLPRMLHNVGKGVTDVRIGVAWVRNACDDGPCLKATRPVRSRIMQLPLLVPEK
jgi:hypothetical protein